MEEEKYMEEMERGKRWSGEWEKRERIKQKEERWERINDSKYNNWYRMVKGKGVPEYLKKGWEKKWSRVVRFRLRNEVGERKYWEEEEGKLCRLCGGGVESWEHIWERCRSWRDGKGS